jgi:hypothetical protein
VPLWRDATIESYSLESAQVNWEGFNCLQAPSTLFEKIIFLKIISSVALQLDECLACFQRSKAGYGMKVGLGGNSFLNPERAGLLVGAVEFARALVRSTRLTGRAVT